MTVAHAPLAHRPRRTKVVRPPSPRAAERQLRRSAARTTGTAWRRAALPGPAVASTGIGFGTAATSVTAVALLCVPLLVWTQASPAAVLTGAVAVAVATALVTLRRVVVGADFVAVRRTLRYHVATVDHVRHLELRAMTGGVLCVHTDDGRCMVLRRAELARPAVRDALRALADCGRSTRDARVCAALGLEEDPDRLQDRYLAA